jgi:hypothetical protein
MLSPCLIVIALTSSKRADVTADITADATTGSGAGWAVNPHSSEAGPGMLRSADVAFLRWVGGGGVGGAGTNGRPVEGRDAQEGLGPAQLPTTTTTTTTTIFLSLDFPRVREHRRAPRGCA